jgi:predicted  nucleic acid-binding Zn-ribbon protein
MSAGAGARYYDRAEMKLSNLVLLLAASCSYNRMDPSDLSDRVSNLETSSVSHQNEIQAIEERQNTLEQKLNTLLRLGK